MPIVRAATTTMHRSVKKSEESSASGKGVSSVKKRVQKFEQITYVSSDPLETRLPIRTINRSLSTEITKISPQKCRRNQSITELFKTQPNGHLIAADLQLRSDNLEKFQSALDSQIQHVNQITQIQITKQGASGKFLNEVTQSTEKNKHKITKSLPQNYRRNQSISELFKTSQSNGYIMASDLQLRSDNLEKFQSALDAQILHVNQLKQKVHITEHEPFKCNKQDATGKSFNEVTQSTERNKHAKDHHHEKHASNSPEKNKSPLEKIERKTKGHNKSQTLNSVQKRDSLCDNKLSKQLENILENMIKSAETNDEDKFQEYLERRNMALLNETSDEKADLKVENFNNFTAEEFSKEYFGEFQLHDDYNDHYTVEAFNDKDNELHITYYEINVTEKYSDEGSDIVLEKSEDHGFIELQNNQENCPVYEDLPENNQQNIPICESLLNNNETVHENSSIKLREIQDLGCVEYEENPQYFPIYENIECFTRADSDDNSYFEVLSFPIELDAVSLQRNDPKNKNLPEVKTHDSMTVPLRKKNTNGEFRKNNTASELEEKDVYEFVDPPPQFRDSSGSKGRRNTIFDDHGNIRMELIENTQTSPKLKAVQRNNSALDKTKIDYVIEEIINSEKVYIKGLRLIVQEYMPFLLKRSPPNLTEKVPIIFGNLDSIYSYTRAFYKQLLNCNGDVEKIGNTFLEYEDLFKMYPKYSKNKLEAEQTFKEFKHIALEKQKLLGERLDLPSYLLTPIQRLGKYQLLLEKIVKQLKRENSEISAIFEKAFNLIKSEMRKGNDSLAIASIKQPAVDLCDKGSFLMRDVFTVRAANSSKKYESMVFLFEKIVVFTKILSKEYFTYHESIEMSNLSLVSSEFDKLQFELTDFAKTKRVKEREKARYTHILEASSEKSKTTWTQEIERILWMQLKQCKEERLKMINSKYKHKDTKETGQPNFNTSPNRNSGSNNEDNIKSNTTPRRRSSNNNSSTKTNLPERHKSCHEIGDERTSNFYIPLS